jgi:glycine hydroxymethyltransferase
LFGAEIRQRAAHAGSKLTWLFIHHFETGDTVLGMNLSHGGHLTRPSINFSGNKIVPYGVRKDTENIDYLRTWFTGAKRSRN